MTAEPEPYAFLLQHDFEKYPHDAYSDMPALTPGTAITVMDRLRVQYSKAEVVEWEPGKTTLKVKLIGEPWNE